MTVSVDGRIAVVGIALRMPAAGTTGEYWRTIRSGRSHIRRFSAEELEAAGVEPALARSRDFVGATAPLAGITEFDAPFFSMSGREAALTDPQHRMFMECCHHALEDAGYAGDQSGIRTGVYASSGFHLYPFRSYLHSNALESLDSSFVSGLHRTVGGYTDFMATRTAFRLGLTGPALGLQSACSSSLVAVHLARQALLTDDVDLAVAGAAAVHVPQITGYAYARGSVLSRTGRCRPFDASADGTVGGNGVAAVVLKRLDRALADGDSVHAVILGSAVNNDGRTKQHFTAPSDKGQRDVVRRALAAAEVSAGSVGYVETHGTGTYKGDPIEFAALTRAFAEDTDRTGYCALGSVKANIGHLDVCSGLAGLIKAVLVVRHGTVPPLAGFDAANPLLALETSPFYLPTGLSRWPEDLFPRRAAVTSLGVGGTNVHMVVEEAPRRGRTSAAGGRGVAADRTPTLLPVSGLGRKALLAAATRLRRHLALNPAARPEDLMTTQALGRRHLRHRLVVFGETRAELARSLDDFISSEQEQEQEQAQEQEQEQREAAGRTPGRRRWTEGVVPRTRLAPVGWMFSGQGDNRPDMAAELYERFAPVRGTLDTCEEVFRDEYGRSLLAQLTGTGSAAGGAARPVPEDRQTALFALQAAQCELWRELRGEPSAVAGHSVGEYGALYAAGALSLEDGLRITAERGRLMEAGCADGRMLAVFAGHEAVSRVLAECRGLDLAAVNGERHHVVAGPAEAVGRAAGLLAARSVRVHQLAVDRAFHSHLVEPVLDELEALAARLQLRPTRLPYVSAVDGAVRPEHWVPDAAYLRRQAREAVRFDRVLEQLTGMGCTLLQELGPGSVLSGLAARAEPAATALPTVRAGGGLTPLWTAMAELHCRGYALGWREAVGWSGGRRVPMPGYPFQRKSYWTGPELVESPGEKKADEDEGGSVMTRPEEEALAQVIRLTADHLGLDEAECEAEVPFFDLGADSLRMINLLQDIEHLYGVKVAVRELFEGVDTPLLLARLVARRTAGEPRTPAEAAASPASGTAPVREAAPVHLPAPAQAPAPGEDLRAAPRPAPEGGPAPNVPEQAAAGAVTGLAAPPAGGEGPFATQASLDALTAQVNQLVEIQMQLMQQVSELLAAGLQAPSDGRTAGLVAR
ncbi:type I polyketide synthase [Streptomyces ovatisporus]|uniref:Type I polyketide synthase n=1 Tax=Streptomyces ovatisporus TaxID=1128682 RepID=A0ABV9AFE0_9ACTN